MAPRKPNSNHVGGLLVRQIEYGQFTNQDLYQRSEALRDQYWTLDGFNAHPHDDICTDRTAAKQRKFHDARVCRLFCLGVMLPPKCTIEDFNTRGETPMFVHKNYKNTGMCSATPIFEAVPADLPGV
eukprot:578201-Amphidinium_carterae.1